MDDAWSYDEDIELAWQDHDDVGTVDVQLLLSWYYENAGPSDVGDLRL